MLHFVAVPKKRLVGKIQCRIKTGQIINKDAICLRRSARYFSRSEHSKCVLIVNIFLQVTPWGGKGFFLPS